ncbi:MAG: BlaI/MecI/CopY family transcriptional regulator [Candidatus Kapaibacterium sp.]|nr:MAG: BlaI/MecI/CopY family transcriptional regulator [Candidatus Kapabacteria bacterium]
MKYKPTDAELEILQVLWQNGAATVRTINDALNKDNDDTIGYTTTLKIMQIMAEKGLLSRDESNRTHIYTAEVREDEVQQAFVSKLMDSVFRGSAMKLVLQALGSGKTSTSELQQIRALLDEELENNANRTAEETAAHTPSTRKKSSK